MPTLTTPNLFIAAAACLAEPDPARKQALTARTAAGCKAVQIRLGLVFARPRRAAHCQVGAHA